jgi:hypothetical protein
MVKFLPVRIKARFSERFRSALAPARARTSSFSAPGVKTLRNGFIKTYE